MVTPMKPNSFEQSNCPVEKKIENFTKYIRRQRIARFLAHYEIFKKQLGVKGSVIECGVHHGGGLMTWAKLSSTLEPHNYHRKIIGFDTFSGFPAVTPEDSAFLGPAVGEFSENYDILAELNACIQEYDENRSINHIPKIELVPGDANLTIPDYIDKNPHLLVSLLYLDFDLYQPTLSALKAIVPRMPKGSIIAFDELNNAQWPGETLAAIEYLKMGNYRLECFYFEPNVSFIQI